MKTQKLYSRYPGLLLNVALLAGLLLFAGCDSSSALLESDAGAPSDLTPSLTHLSEQLDLTAGQTQNIKDLIAKKGVDEPGTRWYVAAELQSTLTEDQKKTMLESVEGPSQNRAGMRGRQGAAGAERFRERREDFEALVGDLTEEQRAQLKSLHEKQRAEIKALIDKHRADGEGAAAGREVMKAAMTEMRISMDAALEGILTDAQFAAVKAAREARQGEMLERRGAGVTSENRSGRWRGGFDEDAREELSAAKIEALSLTSTQQAQIKSAMAAQKEKAAILFEEIKASDGDSEEIRDKMTALREESKTMMAEILTDKQEEIIAIHRALVFGALKNRTEKNQAEDATSRRGSRRFDRLR